MALVVFYGSTWILERYAGLDAPLEIVVTIVVLACLFAAAPGLVFIKRKESPSTTLTKYIHGTPAVIGGVGWILFWLSPALMAIICYIEKLSR